MAQKKANSPKPNPSYADLIRAIEKKMKSGASRDFAPGALGFIGATYGPSIKYQLSRPGSWAKAGPQVLLAAESLGETASAIARVYQHNEIAFEDIDIAGGLIEQQCQVPDEGHWCQRSSSLKAFRSRVGKS